MTGPDEGAVAGRGHLRAAHADREHVIAALKAAFVQGRLDKDEFDVRVGQALASRTYAELAALTADIPAGPADAEPPRKPARTLAKAARRSGICMLVAVALMEGAFLSDNPFGLIFLAFIAVMAASGFLGYGVVDAWQERRSRGQLPPRPGQGRQGLESGRPGRTGHDPAPPGARADRTRADLRTHRPGQDRRRPSRRGIRVRPGIGPVPGAAYGATSAP